jgi:hypothetical protein
LLADYYKIVGVTKEAGRAGKRRADDRLVLVVVVVLVLVASRGQRQAMGMAEDGERPAWSLKANQRPRTRQDEGRTKEGQHRRQEAILEASRRREASAPTREAEATGGDRRRPEATGGDRRRPEATGGQRQAMLGRPCW